ncbi:hypothetical protein [Natronomonas sp. EA1]|uniref:hypothetical protein n=1 Tax=Natronomonas sp. EA1 TaxID=3421655 RepID=UPI003EBD08F3
MDSRERRVTLVRALHAHRGETETLRIEAGGETLEFSNSVLRVPAPVETVEPFLAEHPVFKVKQPETRKASEGVTFVSAKADANHLAGFIDAVFEDLFSLGDGYDLAVSVVD